MKYKLNLVKMGGWRSLIQWGIFLWVLVIGVQFGLFVRHFESQATTIQVARPVGVEGFLPIGAIASLRHWFLSGEIDKIHPAALILFLTFLVMSLLVKKSFCSWLCPVGTLLEGLWKIGEKIFGRNFQMWRWLDVLLRGVKYLLLLFFIKILLLDMPAFALEQFLQSPYWAISDVKMLHFFTHMSLVTMGVLVIVAGLSMLYKNFWCRYLCPYGALFGLISVFSPMKIRRDAHICTDCGLCSSTCPAQLPVDHVKTVHSPECTGCLSCVDVCPSFALEMAPLFKTTWLPRYIIPVLILAIFIGGIAVGMITGHWHSSLGYEDYQRLIPMAWTLQH
jgi:polyferredoxin